MLMKKELMKSYIVWDKHAYSRCLLKNDYILKTFAYIFLNVKELADVLLFEEPCYKQRIFKNLYGQIKIFDAKDKLQADSVFVHRYFISL